MIAKTSNLHVDHNKSQFMDDKLSINGAWSLSRKSWRDLFNFHKIMDNISKTVQDSSIVYIKFEYALSNGYVADDLGWPLTTLNHLNFYILRCRMHLRNWWSQRLQIWCTRWLALRMSQPTDDKPSLIGVGQVMWPTTHFGGLQSYHWNGGN